MEQEISTSELIWLCIFLFAGAMITCCLYVINVRRRARLPNGLLGSDYKNSHPGLKKFDDGLADTEASRINLRKPAAIMGTRYPD